MAVIWTVEVTLVVAGEMAVALAAVARVAVLLTARLTVAAGIMKVLSVVALAVCNVGSYRGGVNGRLTLQPVKSVGLRSHVP